MTTCGTAVKPTALITGASSGIGEALAGCFARAGHDLVLVARSGGKLRALARRLGDETGARVSVAATDLSLAGAAARLAASLARKRIVIDILVNNAGVLEHGAFVDTPALRHQQLIDLNVSGLTAMLAEFVPGMLERGRGRILNVASIAAFQPVPSLATYAATKAYVLSLTESLAEELRGSGVHVTALCPGITATPMLDAAVGADASLGRLPRFLIGEVERVAAEGYRACIGGEVVCVPGALNRAASVAARATPKWLLRRVAGAAVRRAR